MLPDNIKDLGTKIVIIWQKQFKYSLNVQKSDEPDTSKICSAGPYSYPYSKNCRLLKLVKITDY